jgi:hypothetical protein
MEIPSDKKLVAVLGLAVGAGIAMTFSYRGINKKVSKLRPAKTDPERTRATVGRSQKPLPAAVVNSLTIRHDRKAPPKTPEDLQAPCDLRPVHPAPAVLSMSQRLGAGVIDALIIFFACCIFAGISLASGASAPINRFGVVVLTGSVVLIAVFYAYLFKIGGHGTPGQTLQKRRLDRAFAWTPKWIVPKAGARFSPINSFNDVQPL